MRARIAGTRRREATAPRGRSRSRLAPAKESGHEGRYTVIGTIIGAIVGGLGSFAGAAYTLSKQQDQHVSEAREAAYVAEISQGQKFRDVLVKLVDAVDAKDQRRYASLRDREQQLASALYSASVRAYLLVPQSDIDKVTGISTKSYAYFLPMDVKDCKKQRLQAELTQSSDAMRSLVATARSELQNP